MMICKIPFLISHISEFTELEPGDLIATGSPGGSIIEGEEPKNWLKAGDEAANRGVRELPIWFSS